MLWKCRWDKDLSLKEIIEKNTGIPMKEFLFPKRDPEVVNLTDAAELIKDYLDSGRPVKVMADYDCDGVMSGTILYMAFKAYSGRDIPIRFPKRFSEGYGLSMNVINETDSGLIITIDNGIAAVDQIKAARDKGIDVVVIDHHLPRKDGVLPDANIIVDPHVYHGEFDEYCGAGLGLRLAKELIPRNPLLNKLTAFAGIATVADVMRLVGDNRNIVKDSLNMVNNREVTFGMNILLDKLGVGYVEADDYGFQLGPVINAAGRLMDDGPDMVFDLIKLDEIPEGKTGEDIEAMAMELVRMNNKRRDLVNTFVSRAMQYAEDKDIAGSHRFAVIYDKDFHEGINGIIAGQMAERLKMPCITLSPSGKEGILKGSGRAFGDMNLIKVMEKCSDCFVGYGGHAGAAGLSVKEEDLERLVKALDAAMEDVGVKKEEDVLYYDKEIKLKDVPYYIQDLSEYAPFGEGNPKPVFKIDGYEITPKDGKYYMVMGRFQNHVKLFGNGEVSAVAFDMADRFAEKVPLNIDIIGNIYANVFNGNTYNQIEILDYKENEVKKETKQQSLLADLLNFL